MIFKRKEPYGGQVTKITLTRGKNGWFYEPRYESGFYVAKVIKGDLKLVLKKIRKEL